MVDKQAIKILFKRYWSSSGWTYTLLSKEELDYAKEAGVMFEDKEFSHDEIIHQVMKLVNNIELEDVTTQFIASLSTRRLDLRSALGSYIVGLHMSDHLFSGSEKYCIYCGSYGKEDNLNVLNFERFKWGGVRHLHPLYIAFDLELYSKATKLVPTSKDYEIMNNILKTINELPVEAKIRDLAKALAKVFKSNKTERGVLIEILGYCSILSSSKYPGFIQNFIPYYERELPNHSKNDWAYPACWWNGKIGLNKEALNLIFPFSELC